MREARDAIHSADVRADTNTAVVLSEHFPDFRDEFWRSENQDIYLDLNFQSISQETGAVTLPMFSALRYQMTPETCILGPSVNSLWLDLIRALVDEETDFIFEDREHIADLVKLSFEAFLNPHSLKEDEKQFFEGILICYEFRSFYSENGPVRKLFPQAPRLADDQHWRLSERTTGNFYEYSPTTQVLRKAGLLDRVKSSEGGG